MLIAIAALALLQPAERFVEGATFPTEQDVKAWIEKGPEYDRVLAVVLKREHWIAAVREIGEKLGPMDAKWTLTVTLGEWSGTHVGKGDRVGAAATITFNMRRLGEYERKLAEYRKQADELRKKGKTMVWKVPPIKYHRIIHHELVHVLQGEYASPGWFHEGLASWLGDDMNYVVAFAHLGREVQSVEVELKDPDDEYARGMMFFEWLEQRAGKDGIRKLVKATVVDGGDWKKGLEEVTALDWKKIVEGEHAWSREYARKRKPAE